MNHPIHFLAFSRRGLGAMRASPGARLSFDVKSQPSAAPGRPAPGPATSIPAESPDFALLGPGEVSGVHPAQIVHERPRPGDRTVEPENLVAIEFAHPDLPWMFTPQPDTDGRLHPWLMLVVLPTGTEDGRLERRPGGRCPVVRIGNPSEVPDPRQAWAFAHVQVTGAPDAAAAENATREAAEHGPQVRSRLLCPTRLRPDTDYLAALVPTYERGSLAAVEGPVSPADVGTALWTPENGLALPVYHSWTFRTGPAGTFRDLARRLHRPGPNGSARLGTRTVLIEPQTARLPVPEGFGGATAPGVYRVPTAITLLPSAGGAPPTDSEGGPPAAEVLAPDHEPAEHRATHLHEALRSLVNQVGLADDADPLLGPPLYGQWPARVRSIDGEDQAGASGAVPVDPTGRQSWMRQLNLDPSHRIAAGLGARMVRTDQEGLMADAWEQLEDVEAANRCVRWSTLYASMASVLYRRVADQGETAKLRLLSAAAGRVRESPTRTFQTVLDSSALPPEVLSSAFTRCARFVVRSAHRRPAPGETPVAAVSVVADVVRGVQAGDAALRPRRLTAGSAVDTEILDELVHDAGFEQRLSESLGERAADYLQRATHIPELLGSLVERVAEPAQSPVAEPAAVEAPAAFHASDPSPGLQLDLSSVLGEVPSTQAPASRLNVSALRLGALRRTATGVGTPSVESRGVLLRSEHVATRLELGQRFVTDATALAGALHLAPERSEQIVAASALRSAAQDALGLRRLDLGVLLDETSQSIAPNVAELSRGLQDEVVDVRVPLVLPDVRPLSPGTGDSLLAKLEPTHAYATMLSATAVFDPELVRRRTEDPFSPAMASPLFPFPAVERLRRIDEGWVLGGVDGLEPNSACLMQVDRSFVESFLAGSNHEMARELLWRRYPTDLRGSCFRRFWTGPDEDILPMDRWVGPLGTHAPEAPSGAVAERPGAVVVLVVKGDLLRRYPGTIISAVRGHRVPEEPGNAFVTIESRKQLFRGFLGKDVGYAGLDVSEDELRRPPATDSPDEWYIQLLEPHDEPRFGVPDPSTAVVGTPERPDVRHLPAPETDSSAQVATALFRTPFRVLLRAGDFIA